MNFFASHSNCYSFLRQTFFHSFDIFLYRTDHSNNIQNIRKTLKTRTSWSSIETTDSSGIGSHNSLNSNHPRSGHSSTTTLPNAYCHSNSSNESEGIEYDFPPPTGAFNHHHGGVPSMDGSLMYPPPPPSDFNMPAKYGTDAGKYATIDRSHFRRNQRLTSSLRDQTGMLNKQRSNSFGENENNQPAAGDHKMNFPKNKMNTICSRTMYNSGASAPNNTNGYHHPQQQQQPNARPSIYNMFDQQSTAELRKKLSPTATSPAKKPPPPTMPRRNSTPIHQAPPGTAPKPKSPQRQASLHSAVGYPPPQQIQQYQQQQQVEEPKAHTEHNDPDDVTPGSFQDALNKRRLNMRKKSIARVATEGSNV